MSIQILPGTPVIPDEFIDLGDVPAAYTGESGKLVAVKATEDGLEFIAGSGGAVDSVNTQTGVVVLDADDIDDTATTNKFATAAELTKLGGIEALADVTDATNVSAAGAVMDSELIATSAGAGDAGKPIKLDAAGHVDASMINDADINLDSVTEGTTNKFYTATEQTKLAGIEAAADVTDSVNVGSSIDGATGKTTPVDADTMPLIDSAASNVLKKVTWANVKATLKTYFDTLYVALTGNQTVGGIKTFTNGISFGAATLTRFDTGLWTPEVADATTGGNTATGTFNARYYDCGAFTTLWISLTDIDTTGLTGGNTLYVRALPRAMISSTNYRAVGSVVARRVTVSGGLWVSALLESNTSYLNLYEMITDADFAPLTVNDVMASGFTDIYITISYLAQ